MRAGIRSRPWAGIDVGSFSVKLLALQAGVGGSRYWMAEAPLPKPGMEPDRVHSKEVVARAIADCMTQVGMTPRSFRGVTLGISGSDVIIKQITLPLLDDAEVGSALRFEARKHLPFDPSGMIIDYQILGRYASTKKLDVLLAAVSSDHVERELQPLRTLGMDADIVDATPLALTNALAQMNPEEHEPFLMVDLGHTVSHLTLYQRGEPYFTRRLEFGGQKLSAAIAKELRIPVDEAEEWKLAAGSDEPGFKVDWSSREMGAMMQSLQHDLVDELRRSFAFYRTVGNLPESLKLWVSGGCARLPGLSARLSEMLATPVLLFDPLAALPGFVRRTDAGAAAPQFAQALGLALRTT
jgi:type IV pilus assembly protein PilM